ncbi:Phr family secreted Rap phosphatase inhibitor [Bacillus paranthracis]|uniref:Phr family secreted Rap phosphatase inhibitor n=2 Tax=Bacillus TaxID=1386 RepID=A7GVL2_BACCN|nr:MULTISPECIES: Phr family secreted Rap phosphatase inhibitor [Bacillus cereus group]HDR4640428.1 Phr family secreted Rap phosphatase inhibitor [Bacillus cereus]HDX9572894.1 Phr family secreted Rap phosphatase inhibitor [Bacillus mobilis]ABS24170.1 hypothetical protein Bcer98_3989 [Bacillus cytotoxicus NVH 391-98]AWC46762.1 Phr family secreted Rap phosphatase inhibitor [Bacillus cytotoxicus]MCC2358801.1 Phr family secreted Rap phosphatase inhibitor [Bacillus paranthracis]
MMKKLCSIVLSLAIIGIVSFGLNSSIEILQSAHGDYPAPQRTNLVYNLGNTLTSNNSDGNTGGIIANYEHGQTF